MKVKPVRNDTLLFCVIMNQSSLCLCLVMLVKHKLMFLMEHIKAERVDYLTLLSSVNLNSLQRSRSEFT